MDASGIPEAAVDEVLANSYFLVTTHNHALDLALAERILRRGDFAYFGMISSHTKKVQFEWRLAARGIDNMRIERMTCPIGVPGIADKAPEMIAVSVAAQLLQKV